MHSGDLNRDQIQALYHRGRPAADYLAHLQARMDETGFSEADRLYRDTVLARLAMQQLADDLHRLWMGPGYYKDGR